MIPDLKTPLVRERSRVQFSPAAPFKALIYKAGSEVPANSEQAHPRNEKRADVARNWQDEFLDLCDGFRKVDRTCSPTTIYRFYDRSGGLLYVGISGQFAARDEQHLRSSAWRQHAAYARIETVPWRVMAENIEARAIRDEDPEFNNLRPYVSPVLDPAFSGYIKSMDGWLAGRLVRWLRVFSGYYWTPPVTIDPPSREDTCEQCVLGERQWREDSRIAMMRGAAEVLNFTPPPTPNQPRLCEQPLTEEN